MFMYNNEPVSCSKSSICLGWVVQYFLYVVAVVQFAAGDGESKASTSGFSQIHLQFKLFDKSLKIRRKHTFNTYLKI